MIHRLFLLPILFLTFSSWGQELKVEFDKDADFSPYRTYKLGEGAIITPINKRTVPDSILYLWVNRAIAKELKSKGLLKDSLSALSVSYLVGAQFRTDAGSVGPLGLTPGGSMNQNYLRDYTQVSLVVDLNDIRSNKLLYRISASIDSNMGNAEAFIEHAVGQGFKKFSIKPKKAKKKK